jgi:tRNA threonylcarbamoyl adenosine modification protein YjeE
VTDEQVSDPWVMSEKELVAWGNSIGVDAETPLVICLRGDLGAGKSTLARSIARGAGVRGPIPSPTFNLLYRYSTPRGVEIVHIDLYRLRSPDEVWTLGWSELAARNELVMIEWPDRAESLLPPSRWEVALSDVDDPELRAVLITRAGVPGPLPFPAARTAQE